MQLRTYLRQNVDVSYATPLGVMTGQEILDRHVFSGFTLRSSVSIDSDGAVYFTLYDWGAEIGLGRPASMRSRMDDQSGE